MFKSMAVLLMVSISWALAERSQAALFDSGSFESPTYVAGNLHTQDGWNADGEFDVENVPANANSGSQYVATTGSGGSIIAIHNFAESTASQIGMQSFFWIDSGTQWIDVSLRDGDNNASFAAIGFQNAVNGFNHNIVYRQNPSLGGSYVAIGTYTPDTYMEIDVLASNVAGAPLGTYDVYLNGVLIGNDLLQRLDTANSIGRFTIEAEPSADGLRVDDLIIGVVPEPSSFGLLTMGLLGLLRARRKQA